MAKQSRLSEKSEVMTWIFRAFERRIMGSPPPLAYVGLNWTWQPRIWDPQMPSQVRLLPSLAQILVLSLLLEHSSCLEFTATAIVA